MKKIINGRKYNTETATAAAEWSSSLPRNDFGFCEETLYRKSTGEYFLYGRGNAGSKYRRVIGRNCWSAGEEIEPLSYQAAQKWAEGKLSADEYEQIFGEVSETSEKKTIAVSLPVSAVEELKRLAAKNGITNSQVIENLIMAAAREEE